MQAGASPGLRAPPILLLSAEPANGENASLSLGPLRAQAVSVVFGQVRKVTQRLDGKNGVDRLRPQGH
jgi:hypothetical protein